MVTTTAGRARPLPPRAQTRAEARAQTREQRVHRVHLARWVLHGVWRMAVLGAVVGAGLVRLDPFVAAVAGLVTAAVGVVLSEGRMHGPDRNVLTASAGMMAVALAYLIDQLVHLL